MNTRKFLYSFAILSGICALFFATGGSQGVIAQEPVPTSQLALTPEAAKTIPYQGKLINGSGATAPNGLYDFKLQLYDSSSDGQLVWQETQPGVSLQTGLFEIQIGSKAAMPGNLLARKDLWLEISFRGPGEVNFVTLTPRQLITPDGPASPVALTCPHSHFADSWSGSNSTYGLVVDNSGSGDGIRAYSRSTTEDYAAVYAINTASGGLGTGVYATGYNGVSARSTGNGNAIKGTANTGTLAYAIYGVSSTGYAGYFSGKVQVVGNLTKSSGSFKIDHPLDPANKYLYHSFVESPDMMNIYNGNVALNSDGIATVTMPSWFEALNQEFRYQLTAIGAPCPNLYVSKEIIGNRFEIAGCTPGAKVSWQVTGIRHDAYANANRIVVEEDKPAQERGTYLFPELYGKSNSLSVDNVK